MRVNLPDYRFYRTLDGYFIAPMTNRKAVFTLYQFVNNYRTQIGTYTIVDGFVSTDPVEIELSEEGSYMINIQGFTETPSQAKNYYIRHYPTLKSRLVPVIRALVCDCPLSGQDLCVDGQYNLSGKTKNDMYLAINSIIAYKDIFISPCFIKITEYLFRLLLGEDITRYSSRFSTYLDFVDAYGYSPDTESMTRELMSLIYATAYFSESSVIDFDYVATGGTQGATDYNDGEQDALDELFDFASLEECYYTKYKINITEWMAKFASAYEDQAYICLNGTSPIQAESISIYEEIIGVGGTGSGGYTEIEEII